MGEWRFFEEGTIPECATAEWYAERPGAPHVDQDIHRPRLEKTAELVMKAWQPGMSVSDLGCGDGGFLTLIPEVENRWGYDITPNSVKEGTEKRGVDVRFGDIINDDLEYGDISVATETIEHLIDPHGFIRKIAEHSDYFVASSPHTENDRNHYEFHLWAWDHAGYAAMMQANGWHIVEHATSGNFQVILCRSKLRT